MKTASFYFFAAAVIAIILQLFPVPGIFLMVMMAPFWATFLINAGFIALALESRAEIIDRRWMFASIAWFGGYFATAILNQASFYLLAHDVSTSNASQTIAFATDRTALVVDTGRNYFEDLHSQLLENYDLPVVYEVGGSYASKPRAHRIGTPETCPRIGRSRALTASGSGTSYLGRGRPCAYFVPQEPPPGAVKVTVEGGKETGIWLPRVLHEIRITDASGRSINLLSGYARPLKWFPMPVVGCGLNSGAASWQCLATFWRQPAKPLDGDSGRSEAAASVIARALGLRPSPAETRVPAEDAPGTPDLDQLTAEAIARSVLALDTLIADPAKQMKSPDYRSILTRPDLLDSRIDKMVQTLESAYGNPRMTEASSQLQSLIAIVSKSSFERVGPQVIALISAPVPKAVGTTLEFEPVVDEVLAARLGDLGASALPVLEQLLDLSRGHRREGPLRGICRIGRPAAYLADKVADVLMTTKRVDQQEHAPAFLALLRMGRPDLADRDPDSSSKFGSDTYPSWRQSVTPDGPPNICTDSEVWPNLPDFVDRKPKRNGGR